MLSAGSWNALPLQTPASRYGNVGAHFPFGNPESKLQGAEALTAALFGFGTKRLPLP